jgi:hypothetical protein
MNESLNRHLDAIAATMGGFLRGFGDPRCHTGSEALFIREFRKVLDHPSLRLPGGRGLVSYAAAAASYRTHAESAEAAAPCDPICTLMRGLSEPAPGAQALEIIDPVPLQADLAALLRVPVMSFYLQVTDMAAFFARLAKIARQESFPLAAESCPACGEALEVVRALPLVSGVGCTVSYELLRRMVALDLVVSYQEEAAIRTMQPGSTNQ